jgi:hypothetical protein
MRKAVSIGEINVEVFHLFGDLLLKTAFLFLDADDTAMRAPVALYVFQCLFEEERQVFSLSTGQSQAF